MAAAAAATVAATMRLDVTNRMCERRQPRERRLVVSRQPHTRKTSDDDAADATDATDATAAAARPPALRS